MKGHGEKQSRLEDAALAALLSTRTVAAAAEQVGVGERTLGRWMAEPAFKARYREARQQIVEHAIGRLQQATDEAVEALRRNLECGVPAVEVGAAKAVVEYVLKVGDVFDLAARLAALEAAGAAAERRPEWGRA
jgi:hypothetical protein